MRRRHRSLVIIVVALLLGGCGDEEPAPPLDRDGGATTPINLEDPRPPDLGEPRCGDDICQSNENVLDCPDDCLPRPLRHAPLVPDPGYIDPLPLPR